MSIAAILDRGRTPDHLFAVAELDFSTELFADRLPGPWFKLGAQTLNESRDSNEPRKRRVEEVVSRQCVLMPPDEFSMLFDRLESVGNVFSGIGKPGGMIRSFGGAKEYTYAAFYHLDLASIMTEPLVFLHSTTADLDFFINPDLWMFLELEEKVPGSGIWWDPRRGVEALIKRVLNDGRLKEVEILREYLLKYLRARQMSLLVGHYRHKHFFDPPASATAAFIEGNLEFGSPEQGTKAILQNWGLRKGITHREDFLQRRLHLWFEIKPPQLNIDDPWNEQPSFDFFVFTLPTAAGPVAPARWAHFEPTSERHFEGATCDFMDRVYFRQEVLTKYEGAAGFEVKDDGSVSCHHYWGLVRSTSRLGNDLLSTAIGDFAEGVPIEEWPHWRQYAVEPPSPETARALEQEPHIAESVNSVVSALNSLNAAFADFGRSIAGGLPESLWRGSLDSLAGRQLKWVYSASAGDDEFLKRATLASTLFLDGLLPSSLRTVIQTFGVTLHQTFESNPKPLGSRTLLQRLTLVALLVERLHPDLKEVHLLIKQSEGKSTNASPDLQAELEGLFKLVRSEFAPLAFLYDLRTAGGLAHPPSREATQTAALSLGLPRENWHRLDYLKLLKALSDSVAGISDHLAEAAEYLMFRKRQGSPLSPRPDFSR